MHSWMHKRLPTYLLSKQKYTYILYKYIHYIFFFFCYIIAYFGMYLLFISKQKYNYFKKSDRNSSGSYILVEKADDFR